MLRAIGGFVGRIFGSEENVGKTATMIRDGVDKLIYTEEERADYSQKNVELYLEFIRLQSDGGHLARRLLALIVASVWWSTVVLVVIFALLGDAARTDMLIEIIKEFIVWPFVAVQTFYFGHRILQGQAAKGGE